MAHGPVSAKPALRINKTRVIVCITDPVSKKCMHHWELLKNFLEETGISEDDADAMIDSGNLEFGCSFLVDGKWDFSVDKTRSVVYRDAAAVYKYRM